MLTLEDRARLFATDAHQGQVRKYTGDTLFGQKVDLHEIITKFISKERLEELLTRGGNKLKRNE